MNTAEGYQPNLQKRGCIFCVYEIEQTGRDCFDVQPAVTVLTTPSGDREVCAGHATRGDWTRR